ncbi:MORN repeat-containing protein [Fredinandcohnia humi]
MARVMYVDRNTNLLTESELTAFKILHTEERYTEFKKVTLCGICYHKFSAQMDRKVHRMPKTSLTPLNKEIRSSVSKSYYVCPFCKTANEPLRNTCKKCERVLFSTEYETKRVSQREVRSRGTFRGVKKMLIFVGIGLIAFYLLAEGGGRFGTTTTGKSPQNMVATLTGNNNGTYTWPDGTTYTGTFKNGKPDGNGTLVWPNGNKYTGEFLDGEITGYGILEYTDGAKYIGNLRNGQPHGKGKMYDSNGSVFQGQWVNGKPRE